MGWIDPVGKLVRQHTSGGAAEAPAAGGNAIFDQVSRDAARVVIAEGLAAAFRSGQTPGFGRMLSTLFANSTGEQKAGMLNRLLTSVSPSLLTKVLSGVGLAGLAGGPGARITPDEAQKLTPEAVQQLAANAEKSNPSIIDTISGFYAQHGALVKTLGGTVLTVALTKIAERQRQT